MKIRWDFVTNSSTTSFIMICKGKPSLDDFLGAVGAARGPSSALFRQLYDVLCANMGPVTEAAQEASMGVYDLVKRHFSDLTAGRVQDALRGGMNVWYGRLASDGSEVEAFFCTDSFEVETGSFYLNALPGGW